MTNRIISVVFFCRKTKVNKKGKSPISMRITTSGVSTELYIQCSIEPEKWDQKAERVIGRDAMSTQINKIIMTYRAKVWDIYHQLVKENRQPNCFFIKNQLSEPLVSRMFLKELSDYCQRKQSEVGTQIIQLTANKYHRIYRYLKEYTMERYEKEDIPLTEVNYLYIDGFNKFLQTVHNCNHNGAINLLYCLRTFILYCIGNEWIDKDPFDKYKLRKKPNKEKEHLTKEELECFINKPMPILRLERVRDTFAFCCFTGMTFTDVEHLRREHISKDDKGVMWIRKPREKTATVSRILLLPYPIKILNKYENDIEMEITGKVIPIPSNQKMNGYLKELSAICNINKNLTTHCARHTFACIAVDYGMPIDVLAKILGHNNPNVTRHYVKISDSNIEREMKKLWENVFSKAVLRD